MEARVVEQPLVVGEPDEGLDRTAQARVGEGQAQAVEQGIEAEGGEEQQARGQEADTRSASPAGTRSPRVARVS